MASALADMRERGRGFSGTLETLAAEVSGDQSRLLPALDSSALRRAADHAESDILLSPFAWRTGYAISASDQILERMNAPWYRTAPVTTVDEWWLAELRSGLDAFARICWCLRFGYTFAAVALTRHYIERWTYNLAFSSEIEGRADESDEEYIDRVWEQYAPMLDGRIVSSEWSILSELLHGRPWVAGSNSILLELQTSTSDRARLNSFIVRAAELPLRQVRGGVAVAASDHGLNEHVRAATQVPVSSLPRITEPPDFLKVFFRTHDYRFVTSELAATTSEWGKTYRRMVARRSEGPTDLKAFDCWMAIEERWVRAIDDARGAFEQEAMQHPASFNPEFLEGLLLQYRSISEMADLVAGALQNADQANSLRTAAMALESAWVLWLQDVDDSLSRMRTVLESTARARVHRLKPKKAEKLESRGRQTTPYRWVEAAGWGRLAPFVRALGEFVHVRERSRHTGSRELLTIVQREPFVGGEKQTARARALEEVAAMLANESVAVLHDLHPALAAQFRERVLFETVEQGEEKLAEWLDRVLKFRDHDFGAADYDRSAGTQG